MIYPNFQAILDSAKRTNPLTYPYKIDFCEFNNEI